MTYDNDDDVSKIITNPRLKEYYRKMMDNFDKLNDPNTSFDEKKRLFHENIVINRDAKRETGFIVNDYIDAIEKKSKLEDEPKLSPCPKCNRDNIARIVFCNISGFTFYKKQIQQGTIVIKGELDIKPSSARWHCNDCEHEFGAFSDVFARLEKPCPCCNSPKALPDSPFCTDCMFKLIQGPDLEPIPLGGVSKLDFENLFNNIKDGFPELETEKFDYHDAPTTNAILQLPDNTRIHLDDKNHVVGRAELLECIESEQDIDPQVVSRQHFTIFHENGRYYIEDGKTSLQEKPSTNKTYLNGFEITGKGKKKLKLGDFINIAKTIELRFFTKDERCEWYERKTDPKSEELTRKGKDMCTEGKFEESLKYFDEALEIDPKNLEALMNKANSLRVLGRYDEAIIYSDKMLEIDSTYVIGILEKTSVLYDAGTFGQNKTKLEEALLLLDKAMQLEPNNGQIMGDKADVLIELGKVQEALVCYDKSIELEFSPFLLKHDFESIRQEKPSPPDDVIPPEEPNNPEILFKKGMVFYELRRFEEAILWYNKAIAIDPYLIDAQNHKGLCLSKLEQYEPAISCFDKVIAVNPNLIFVLNNKGKALAKLGRFDEAQEWYDKALALEPNDFVVLFNKAIAFTKTKRHKDAIRVYEKILEIEPNNLNVLGNLGVALSIIGKLEDALLCYDRILKLDPNNPFLENRENVISLLKRQK